jgi:hypothetical protein
MKTKVFMCYKSLVSYKIYNQEKKKKFEKALLYNQSIITLKAFESFRYFTFRLKKDKKIKNWRSIKFCAKNLYRKTFLALLAFKITRLEKKNKILKAFKDRERIIK